MWHGDGRSAGLAKQLGLQNLLCALAASDAQPELLLIGRQLHHSTNMSLILYGGIAEGFITGDPRYRAPKRYGPIQRRLVARTRNKGTTGAVSFYLVMKPAENEEVSELVFHIVRY
jgi:hypothetical protein